MSYKRIWFDYFSHRNIVYTVVCSIEKKKTDTESAICKGGQMILSGQEHTSDGASAVVAGDPSQGDGGGGGGGDGQTRLIWRNCECTRRQSLNNRAETSQCKHLLHSCTPLKNTFCFFSPCTTRLTMMVSKPRVFVAVQV